MTENDELTGEKTVIMPPGVGLAALQAPAARLVCTDPSVLGNESAREIRLSGGDTTLGRGDDNDVPIKAEGVSRHHARVYWGEGGWGIEDLRSRNGVAVNKARVQHAWLKPGDTVQVGNVPYRFVLDDGGAKAGTAQRPPDLTGMSERTLVLRPAAAAQAPAGKAPAAGARAAKPRPRPGATAQRKSDEGGLPGWAVGLLVLAGAVAGLLFWL